MLETHEIRYFVVLARELHFSRAAEKCCISQPALTRAIRKMEAKLGGLLFDRRPGIVSLTELGQTILPRLEMALAEIQQAKTEAAALATAKPATARIGVMCTSGPSHIVPVLISCADRQDDVALKIIEARAATVVDRLLAGDIDIGIAAWPSYPPEIEHSACYTERYAIAVPESHVLAPLDTVPLDQLAGETYLERLNCEFDAHFASQVGEWTVDMDVGISSELEDWIQCLVAHGRGIAIVPEFMPVMAGIRLVPLDGPSISRTLSILTARGRRLARPIERLLADLRSVDWSRRVRG